MTLVAAAPLNPQVEASEPELNVFVSANAGSGKTTTLVRRVARLLLRGARPDAILCVTYTRAAAAEMQNRLFDLLGEWSVMGDVDLARELASIGEPTVETDLGQARKLFARALETPGGLKIQTLHAFCEKLLRRFPLEAGVAPGFTVMGDEEAARLALVVREALARTANERPDSAIGRAWAHFAVAMDPGAFEAMLALLAKRADTISAYVASAAQGQGVEIDIFKSVGLDEPTAPEAIAQAAVADTDWGAWFKTAKACAAGNEATDQPLGRKLQALAERGLKGEPVDFDQLVDVACTSDGPRKKFCTKAVAAGTLDWFFEEQKRICAAAETRRAAIVARDTVHALALGAHAAAHYDSEKTARGWLDFADLVRLTRTLLTHRADAAWVLYKLDGGIEHILLDEAQDTAPEQWEIIRPLTEEFFAGAGAGRDGRTLFVVGDEKQSIYSFQGAAPELLRREAGHYRRRIEAAGRAFVETPLRDSWRSTPEILAFVDATFSDPASARALTAGGDGDALRHVSRREKHPGCVDLWPYLKDEKRVQTDAWAPLDEPGETSARKRLAAQIAKEAARIIADGDAVREGDGSRPATAGDILILVRGRDALFDEIIRALKQNRIPVAGADKLMLSDHIVFHDLMALLRFCLHAGDDLSLAALLRSPFCEIDEQALFDLAQPRARSLWGELIRRADERPAFRRAVDFLTWVRSRAFDRAPFDLLAQVLAHRDVEGRSMRQRILTRLGHEAEDALDEALNQVAAAEARGIFDLERLVATLASAEITVKRESESAGGRVRIMSVHGAKGLEAPIVILPDTVRAENKPDALLDRGDGGFFWAQSEGGDCLASTAARTAAKARAADENRRLLYVGLTRARDRLIICGRVGANRNEPPEDCWYALVQRAFSHEEIAAHVRDLTRGDLSWRRFGPDPRALGVAAARGAEAARLPAWVAVQAAQEMRVAARAPSSLTAGKAAAAPSPLERAGGLGRFRRGDLIHKLLEVLPDLPDGSREEAAARLLAREQDLTPEQRAEMAAAALSVLRDARFAAVFGEGSRPEVGIAGGAPELPAPISGRIDRLVVTADRVLVVDYKTNRPSPDRAEDADPAYLDQMAAYVAVLRQIFPDRPVEAAFVWTDGPKLTPIEANVIAARLARLARAY